MFCWDVIVPICSDCRLLLLLLPLPQKDLRQYHVQPPQPLPRPPSFAPSPAPQSTPFPSWFGLSLPGALPSRGPALLLLFSAVFFSVYSQCFFHLSECFFFVLGRSCVDRSRRRRCCVDTAVTRQFRSEPLFFGVVETRNTHSLTPRTHHDLSVYRWIIIYQIDHPDADLLCSGAV